jgi:hypothetical protein
MAETSYTKGEEQERLRDAFAQLLMQTRGEVVDRRDDPDMTPEWRNLPGALSAMGTSVGNYLFGPPQSPEVPNTPLGDALGKRDIKSKPKITSRSPLDSAIDAITDEVSVFRKPGEKLGSDIPFSQRQFSPGVPEINRAFGLPEKTGKKKKKAER